MKFEIMKRFSFLLLLLDSGFRIEGRSDPVRKKEQQGKKEGDRVGGGNDDQEVTLDSGLYFGYDNIENGLTPRNYLNLYLSIDDYDWMIAATEFIDKGGNQLSFRYPVSPENHYELFINWSVLWFPQPSTFWNARLFNKVGLLDESLSYVMDVDYWYRFMSETNPKTVNDVTAVYRCHEQAKTIANNDQSQKELLSWVNQNIFCPNEDLNKKIAFTLSELRRIQIRNQQLENLNNHIVIGKFIKMWKTFINPDLDI